MTYTLITGASGGIGLEFAKLFASKGHNLVLVARNEEKLKDIKKSLERDFSIKCTIIIKDLSLVNSAKELYLETKKQNINVDHLINNAGFGDHSSFLSSNFQRQYEMVQLHVTTLMELTYLYGNDMKENNFGRILNLASIAAISGGPYMATYYATKSFVLSFSQALNIELKKSGVSVTALCPGPTNTDFEKNAHLNNSKMFTFFKPASASNAALKGYKAMIKGKSYIFHSLTSKLMNITSRFVTRNFASKFASWVNGKPIKN